MVKHQHDIRPHRESGRLIIYCRILTDQCHTKFVTQRNYDARLTLTTKRI
jgi:hypothetical protein